MSEMSTNPKDLIEVSLPGDTISIRQFSLEDAQRYFDLIDYDREHYSQFDDVTASKYQAVEDVRESMLHPKPNKYRFGIWDGDTMVGSVNLTMHEDGADEIGYWVGAQYTGHGYAARALKPLTAFGFNHLNKEELFARVFVGNEASRKTLEKVGFTPEGEEDGHWIFKLKRDKNGG